MVFATRSTSRNHFSDHRARPKSNAWVVFALTLAITATGMAYSVWWPVLVQHKPNYWIYPFDLFGTVQATHWIEWGSFSYLYDGNSGVLTLPGFAILLLPVVALSDALHLLTTSTAFPVLKPTQWLLLGPVTMAMASIALAGLDALARSTGLSVGRRRVMLIAEAAVVWGAIVRWGHPEDVIALGLSALALSRSLNGRTVSAGWLLGAALAMQLYVVLIIPIFVGLLGRRRTIPLLARASLLPGTIFFGLLIPNARPTFHVLLDQPTQPLTNHPTPWVLIAPHVGPGVVAGGPGRLAGLAGACLLGYIATRYRDIPLMIVWLAAFAFSLRCVTEAVMAPYYVEPAIALALVAITSRSWRHWATLVLAGSALTVLTYHRLDIWVYWCGMALPFGIMLTVSRPSVGTTSAVGGCSSDFHVNGTSRQLETVPQSVQA